MVRLVFRPYTHVGRTICTSVPLRASTRVSPGFTLRRHSSPSFGSRRACSRSNPPLRGIGRRCCLAASRPLALASRGGLSPFRSHARRTPWSVFQDGSNETVTPESLTCLVPHLALREMGTDRPRAHVGFLDPTHRSEGARRQERILPALAPPPYGESSRLGPIDGPSAPRGELGTGDRGLSPSDSRTPELSRDDLPPTVADPVRFPFDDFKRF
jgi:hypothetical protein